LKILSINNRFDICGARINAIELGAVLQDKYGHDVVLAGIEGPLVPLTKERDLRFIPLPAEADPVRVGSGIHRLRALRAAVRQERPDLVQIWDPCVCDEVFYAAYVIMQIPIIVICMDMSIPPLPPKVVPITFGTPELTSAARNVGFSRAEMLLPPVDVALNAPGAVDPRPFMKLYSVKPEDITLVTVSRLVKSLKGESLYATLDAVRDLGRSLPVRFLIVGDGQMRSTLESRAKEVNQDLGRPAVVLTGPLVDPRPAYAAADLIIGMGTSALRGMAFEKPVIVVGEGGFVAPFTPKTAESLYYKGMYGVGADEHGTNDLIEIIRGLANTREQWSDIGRFSREFVLRHFSLDIVGDTFDRLCCKVAARVPSVRASALDGLRAGGLGWLARRLLGKVRHSLISAA
jgi:L-malate glycosyltransferase